MKTTIRFFALIIFTFAVNSFVFGQDTTLTVTSDGKVGIGTTTPSSTLDVNGTVKATAFVGDGSGLTGISGGSGGLWNKSGNNIYYNNGNVGIGTSTPGEKLDIYNGTLRITTKDVFLNSYLWGSLRNVSGYGLIIESKSSLNPSLARISLITDEKVRMVVSSNGTVGIGTTNPQYGLLELKTTESMDGGLTLYRGTGNTARSWINSDDVWLMHRGGTTTKGIAIDASGKVGIGTRIPSAALDIVPDANKNLLEFSTGRPWVFKEIGSGGESRLALQSTVNGKWFEIRDINGGTTAHFYTHQESRYDRVWLVPDGGSVGIGTRSPNSTLAVNGKITCKEVEVTLSGWSDFVFADNYELMPLEEVEKHIKLNKRLPDIPSEKEVLENGLNLGEMQSKLLQKIEELTLYVIDIKKENAELRQRLSALEK